MIGYYTDNNVSKSVMASFIASGIDTKHISEFKKYCGEPAIFYGILRGSGIAMKWCEMHGVDYYYVDNGYFDAQYINDNGYKNMDGLFRIVKNGMIEPYTGAPELSMPRKPLKILLMKPSPYSAFMHDTTPEDWVGQCAKLMIEPEDEIYLRDKSDKNLKEQLERVDAVLAFNSMAVMPAIEMGKAVYTTHGIIRNMNAFGSETQYFDYKKVSDYYKTKQFTLEQISKGEWQ
jgi:hypothetical protein